MAGASPFRDDWHDCLRAHYTQVVRDAYVLHRAPTYNADTLRGVLLRAGISQAEIEELFVRATMRADEVGADFVPPDFALTDAVPVIVEASPAPADAPVPADSAAEVADEDAAHAEPPPDPAADELTEPQTPPETPEPEPRQLTLF